MLGRDNCTYKQTHYLSERKAIAASLQLLEANDSKGFHMLKAHVLNCLMTGWCLHKSLQLRPKFHSLFLQNSFDFQKKMLHLKVLNRDLDCTDVNFIPENVPSLKSKGDTQSDSQPDKVITVTLSCMCTEG